MCFITYKGLMVIFLAFNGDTSIGISLPIFLELWQLFFEKNNSFYQHINEIKAGIYLWIFTFFSGFVCNNTTNRFMCYTVLSNKFKCWGASGVSIINFLIFNRTIAKEYINISDKESVWEYYKKIISVGA